MKVLLCILSMLFGMFLSAANAYNFFTVNCDTLKGKGEVVVWFEDLRYNIPVECE